MTRTYLWIFALAVMMLSLSVSAGTHKRTRLLHDVYCKGCHGATLYIAESQRKLSTREQVKKQVFSYRGTNPLTDQELTDITDYLWLDYYSQ